MRKNDKRVEYFLRQVEILKEKLSMDIIQDGALTIFVDSVTGEVLDTYTEIRMSIHDVNNDFQGVD